MIRIRFSALRCITLLIPTILAFTAAAQESEPVAPQMFGDVIGMTESAAPVTAVDGGAPKVGERKRSKEYTFLAPGKLSEEIYYAPTGEIERRNVYSYTDDGNLKDWVGYDQKGVLVWKYTYEYDEHGRLIKETSYGAGGNVEWRIEYAYSADSALPASKTTYDEKGEKKLVSRYLYDSSGKSIGWETRYADGSLLKKNAKDYSPDGKLTGESSSDASGAVFERIEYRDSEAGRETRTTSFDNQGNVKRTILVERDEQGNIVSETSLLPDGTLEKRDLYQYVYDKSKNWVERAYDQETLKFGKVVREPRTVTYRAIRYRPEAEVQKG